MKYSKERPLTNLKRNYILHFETGLILALLTVLVLFKLNLQKQRIQSFWTIPEHEILTLESIPQTNHKKIKPKLPPNIFVPPKIPDHALFKDEIKDLAMELTIPDPLPLPKRTSVNAHYPTSPHSYKGPSSTPGTTTYVDKTPRLIGGREGLRKRIKYPRKAIRDHIQGRVIIQFIIDEKGTVRNPRILKGIRTDVDKEAVKAISKAHFIPARKKGKAVPVEYIIFIYFLIENDS